MSWQSRSVKWLRLLVGVWALSFLLSSIAWNMTPNASKYLLSSSFSGKTIWGGTMEGKRWLRSLITGQRRLTDSSKGNLTLVVQVAPSAAPVYDRAPSLAPTVHAAPSLSTSPPVVNPSRPTSNSSGNSNKLFSTQTIPAIMVGIAGSIIVCALFLYINDVKDRCRHDDWVRAHQHRQRQQHPALEAIVTTTTTSGVGGAVAFRRSHTSPAKRDSYTSSSTGDDRPSMGSSTSSSLGMVAYDAGGLLLPPILGPELDDMLDPVELMCLEFPTHFRSFSQVSTITGSYLGGGGGGDQSPELFEDFEENEQPSLGITELNDMHRLDQNTDLTSLVAMQRSRVSSSRSASRLSSSSSSRGLAKVDETAFADRNESTSVISAKRPLSQDQRIEEEDAPDFGSSETRNPLTIIGLASQGSDEMCHDDLVDIGSVVMDDDMYIVQIHCDDGDSVECYEAEDGVVYRRDLNGDGGATESSGESSTCGSMSVVSDSELPSTQLLGEMQYASDATPTKKSARSFYELSPNTFNIMVPSMAQELESRDVEDNRLGNVRETPDGYEVEKDQRMAAPISSNEMLQLEELISSIPFDHLEEQAGAPRVVEENRLVVHPTTPTPMNEFVRDIYFVPIPLSTANDDELLSSPSSSSSSRSPLGMELRDASSVVTHPTVATVAPNSPLAGRIFEGDFVLRVNDAETAGLSGDNVHRLINCIQSTPPPGSNTANSGGLVAKMIKLTVMSSQSDGSDSMSDESIDLGILETAFEV